MERQRIPGEMNRGRNRQVGGWRHSGTRSIWLMYMYVKGVKAERVRLELKTFSTGSGEVMNVRANSSTPHFKY